MNSIFVSSSFKDMQHERDTIRYKTLPQINEYLRNNYGQETTIIDLRWGINTNETDEYVSMSKIVRTCLFEIDNCKPFMIVLLGDRYGTIIKKELFEKYTEDFKLEGIEDIGVTELEIRYAMYLAKQDKMHVYFYFRDMDYSTVSDKDKTNIYFDFDNIQEKKRRLENLKREIRTNYPEQCRVYHASLDKEKGIVTGLNVLSDLIFEDIRSCISVELGIPKKSPWFIDDASIISKQISFVGRNEELNEIDSFITSSYYNVALLQGEAGAGKSAIMANIPRYLSTSNREFLTVFCGQSDSSDTALGIMSGIVYRLRSLLNSTSNQFQSEEEWSIEQWHKEMDALVSTYCENENKQLVILIDAIDQMIQDIYTQKMYFLPSLHNKKVKVLLTATTEYQIEKSLPLLEKMTLIKIKDPTPEQIDKVIDEIWHKYGKPSVATEIKKRLLEKPLSNNYLYINLLLNRLVYIGSDVFSNENNNERHIIDTIKQIIDEFPDTLDGAAKELLSTISKCINKDLGTLLFSFLCLSNHGLRITDIQSLCGELYDASDFSYIKKLLGNFIFEREDHRYDFTHKIFRGGLNSIDDAILNKYFAYSSALPSNDSLSILLVIHSSICAKRHSYIYDMMAVWSETPTDALKAAEYLAQFIETDINVGVDLIECYPVDKNGKTHLAFITEYLIPFLSPSATSKRFIDALSDVVFSDDFDITSISVSEIKNICEFEKKRFNINAQYSGKRTIETNRYYLCLEELLNRSPTYENLIQLENFRLDYEPYWDCVFEKYDFSIDREDIEATLSCVSKDISRHFSDAENIDGILLCAKAYIKQADCEYGTVFAFRNEHADNLISNALELIDKAAEKALILSPEKKINCMLKIAEYYTLIGKIYMRVTSESRYASYLFRYSIYEQASEFFQMSISLYSAIQYKNLNTDAIENLLELLYYECVIISKGNFIEDDTVKDINKVVSELLDFIETNMYRIVQSQTICTQYALLCAVKADVISNEIPVLGHVSERELYPWSTIYTKDENYRLYETLKNMDYWCDKSVYLYKYLFSINPTPGNIASLIGSIKNRIDVLDYYEYRSKETIDRAGTKNDGIFAEIDVSKDDIIKDRSFQERRKIPFLLTLCEAINHPNMTDVGMWKGVYLIVASKILILYRTLKDDECWLSYKDELTFFEKGLINCFEYALDNRESFAFYLLTKELISFDFSDLRFYSDREKIREVEQEYSLIIKETPLMYNSLFSSWYHNWIL